MICGILSTSALSGSRQEAQIDRRVIARIEETPARAIRILPAGHALVKIFSKNEFGQFIAINDMIVDFRHAQNMRRFANENTRIEIYS